MQVNITDVNDNHPVFSDPHQEVHVSEIDPPETVVATVSATDRDQGIHMEITYAINNTGVPFEIADPSVSSLNITSFYAHHPYSYACSLKLLLDYWLHDHDSVETKGETQKLSKV